MLAVAPLFAVLGGSLMLELSVPVLRALAETPGKIDAQAAMAFFMIGAVHVALMVLVLKVAGTMVAGWTVFGLAGGDKDADRTPAAAAPPAAPATAQLAATAEANRPAPARAIRMGPSAPMAANDTGPAPASSRETRIVAAATAAAAHAPAASANASLSRSRGIGSRFRAPANSRLARSMEKFK
jgi:type IV secretion system protein VirB6